MFDRAFREWLIKALVTISKQLNNIQRGLDTLLGASTSVSTEQLKELTDESKELKATTDALTKAIEQQKEKG